MVRPKTGVSEEDYVAGLWLHDLPSNLLWRGCGTKRNEEYITPSWSWASVRGQLYWTLNVTKPAPIAQFHLKIIESNITNEGNNIFGLVTEGHLTIEGSIHRIKLSNPKLAGWDMFREPFPPSPPERPTDRRRKRFPVFPRKYCIDTQIHRRAS